MPILIHQFGVSSQTNYFFMMTFLIRRKKTRCRNLICRWFSVEIENLEAKFLLKSRLPVVWVVRDIQEKSGILNSIWSLGMYQNGIWIEKCTIKFSMVDEHHSVRSN